jgi:hypothetical protein
VRFLADEYRSSGPQWEFCSVTSHDGISLPASALAHELFGAMQAQGWGELDHSAVMRVIELLSGVEVCVTEE